MDYEIDHYGAEDTLQASQKTITLPDQIHVDHGVARSLNEDTIIDSSHMEVLPDLGTRLMEELDMQSTYPRSYPVRPELFDDLDPEAKKHYSKYIEDSDTELNQYCDQTMNVNDLNPGTHQDRVSSNRVSMPDSSMEEVHVISQVHVISPQIQQLWGGRNRKPIFDTCVLLRDQTPSGDG
ncbi:uncharacterized protein LOC133307949 isoform X1 [Gastrolobium bilobum]|uniref:uncharacterized protein LOC133307949 isoform X1 n=1 Tax=Gastrolobium bilobum TaxID=150636 RepID=UPI002AAFE7CB|nr:uncharacterized protein LOC133307949 isoform X1 [Gastrolobium bilobum]